MAPQAELTASVLEALYTSQAALRLVVTARPVTLMERVTADKALQAVDEAIQQMTNPAVELAHAFRVQPSLAGWRE